MLDGLGSLRLCFYVFTRQSMPVTSPYGPPMVLRRSRVTGMVELGRGTTGNGAGGA